MLDYKVARASLRGEIARVRMENQFHLEDLDFVLNNLD